MHDVIAGYVVLDSHGWKAEGNQSSLHDLYVHVCVISDFLVGGKEKI